MSFFKRAGDVSADLAAATKRQARRAKLELEARRLASKIESEKGKIGHAVYPLLDEGKLQLDVPEVQRHMQAIASLKAELAERRAAIEALSQDGDEQSEADANARADDDGWQPRA